MEQFFASVRKQFGALSQSQVDGFNVITAACAKAGLTKQQEAYVLATVWHETAKTMQPIDEYGKGAGRAYGVPAGQYGHIYYGRGYPQLTWLANYEHANKRGHEIGFLNPDEDLVKNPELMLRPDISANVLIYGMVEGWFTGKKLSDFTDYLHMRTIINGYDKAAVIATYAGWFETALSAMPVVATQTAPTESIPVPATPQPAKPVPLPTPQKPASTAPIGLLQAIINIFIMLFTRNPKP